MKAIINNIFSSILCRSISAICTGIYHSLWAWPIPGTCFYDCGTHALDLQLSIYQILFLVFEGMMKEKRCMFKK